MALKTKRLLTDEEFDIFLNIREAKGDKAAAKYIGSLKYELFEEVEDTTEKKKK